MGVRLARPDDPGASEHDPLLERINTVVTGHPHELVLTALVNLLHYGLRVTTNSEQKYGEALDEIVAGLKEMRALDEADVATKQ